MLLLYKTVNVSAALSVSDNNMDNMDILVQLGLDLNTSDFSSIEHLTYDEEGVHDNFTNSGIFKVHCL